MLFKAFFLALLATHTLAWPSSDTVPDLAGRAAGAVAASGLDDDTALLIKAIQVLDEARAYLVSQGGPGTHTASVAARAAALEAAEAARLAGRATSGAFSGAYSSAAHRLKDALHLGMPSTLPSMDEVVTAAGRAAGVLPGETPGPSGWRKAAVALHLASQVQPEPSALSTAARKAAASMSGVMGDGSGATGGGLLSSLPGGRAGEGGGPGGLTGLMMGRGGGKKGATSEPSIYERMTGTGAAAPAPPSVLDKVKDALHFGGKAVSEAAGTAGEAVSGATGGARDAAADAVDALSHSLSSFASDASSAASDAASTVQGVSADTAVAAARKLIDARDVLDKKWEEAARAYGKTPSSTRSALVAQWADAQRARVAATAKLDESAHHLMIAAKKAGWEAPKAAVAEL